MEKNKIELILPFLGNRKYLHGTTMLKSLLEFIPNKTTFCLRIMKIIKSNVIEVKNYKTDKIINARIDWEKENQKGSLFITELNPILPVKKEIYFTQNKSAYFSIIDHKNSYKSKKKIKVKKRTGINNRVLLLSRSYSRNIELSKKHFKTDKAIFSGSSIKFCLIASGKGNIYPRLGTTMEWDTAAGHAILNAAGGSVTTLDRKVLKYGKKGFKNPSFIAKS